MRASVLLSPGAIELLELAKRARMHADRFAHDEIGGRLLEFAKELEARVERLMDGRSE